MCHHHEDDLDWPAESEREESGTDPSFVVDEPADDVELDREFEEPETKTPSDDD